MLRRESAKKKAGAQKPRRDKSERPKKGLNLGFLFLVFIFLAGTGVFMLVQHQCAVRSDLKTRRLESSISAEKSKQESLRLTLARLKSPGRVARIAIDELGLSEPGGVIYLKYARDASGNVVTQSTYEELAVPEPLAEDKEEKETVSAEEEKSPVEETGAATSGTSR
ncbi:MAG: FtsB/FtsL family cell division protein [Candidatus Geothermincolia bacterium]